LRGVTEENNESGHSTTKFFTADKEGKKRLTLKIKLITWREQKIHGNLIP
jgi:hypothetical protein